MHYQKTKKILKKRKKTQPHSHYQKDNPLTIYFAKLIDKKDKIR